MNLIFRLLLLLIRSRKLERIHPQQLAYFDFKVLPTDCDFNLHMTNSRYTSVLDLARTQYLMQVGAGKAILLKGWVAVLSGQSISFSKRLSPLRKCPLPPRWCFGIAVFVTSSINSLLKDKFTPGRSLRWFLFVPEECAHSISSSLYSP